MINVVSVEDQPACILFGQPVRGGQQAAWFSEGEVEAARKAKNAKTLATITPVPPELREVVKGLARGRVEGGQVILTKAAPDAYAKLLAASAAQRKNGAGQTAGANTPKQATAVDTPEKAGDGKVPAAEGATTVQPAPASTSSGVAAVTAVGDGWSQLKVGDLVLACYGGPADGWWAARILKIEGDAFALAWVDETEALARRPRVQLALLNPKML